MSGLSLKKPHEEEDSAKAIRQAFIVTVGEDSAGKAGLAFAQAVYAAAHGRSVFIFLVLEGAKWAYSKYGTSYSHPCFDNPIECLNDAIDLGCEVVLCSTCHDNFSCDALGELKSGIEVSGFSKLSEFVNSNCSVITY